MIPRPRSASSENVPVTHSVSEAGITAVIPRPASLTLRVTEISAMVRLAAVNVLN